MPDPHLLIDPIAAILVCGGTLGASALTCGWRDTLAAAGRVRGLFRRRFTAAATREQLAGPVALIRRDGVIRGEPVRIADRELSDGTAALIRHRSLEAMLAEHQRHRVLRQSVCQRAVGVLDRAGELAPVFGLAGTLLSLSQLPAGEIGSGSDVMAAISTAVVSTLYGLLLAHLAFMPLARAVERNGELEESERAALVEWLVEQLRPACPPRTDEKSAAPDREPDRPRQAA